MPRPGTFETPITPVGQTTARLIAPDNQWRRIHNMVPTQAGGLMSVSLPIPFITNAGTTPSETTANPAGGSVAYGTTRSIFHAYVDNEERELLLLHVDNEIWEFTGWNRGWRLLIGDAGDSPVLAQHLNTPLPMDYPTQWVRTPKGVVIIPSGGQACFYDGTTCLQLGYTERPGPPVGLGPSSSSPDLLPDVTTGKLGINDSGYACDGLYSQEDTAMPAAFGYGRLGTVQSIEGVADPATNTTVTGYLTPGRYRAKQQWVNIFGDVSPLSHASNDIHFDRQPALMVKVDSNHVPDLGGGGTDYSLVWSPLESVKKQVGWAGLMSGPTGTIGRVLYRTRDILGKGDTNFYEVPSDASVNSQAFATLPDNVTHFYPDNIPDEWLFNQPDEIEPVPPFQLACLGFGRLFIGSTRQDPGALWYSDVGRYGTILARSKSYPDPEGARLTGMFMVADGMLVFTRNSTFLITERAGVLDRQMIDSTKGCVAPSSIRTLPHSGKTIWLGQDGFYSYQSGVGVQFEWEDRKEDARHINRGRMHQAVAEIDPSTGQYRCWVPMYSAIINNLAWCFDERNGWTSRNDIYATGVTATSDSRGMMIACGRVSVGGTYRHGVWVLDRSGNPATGEVWTSWQRSTRSNERASIRKIKILLRETFVSTSSNSTKLSVSFERDYRVGTVGATNVYNLYPKEWTTERPGTKTEPDAWGTSTWANARFRERRPFWITVDTDIPECESWRMKITSDERFEILGYSTEEQPRDTGGAAGYK